MDEKKINHKIYSKLRKEKIKLWSFSAVSGYENCPYSYYLSKIEKIKGKDNIYTKSGSLSHSILENHYEDNEPINEMLEKFNNGMLEILSDGFRFASHNTEVKYLENMRLYFQSFYTDTDIVKCEEFVAMPLWKYDTTLQDNYFNGWIDAVLNRDGEISIGDFKSSTIYTGKNLIEHSKQLILYAIAYEYLYNKKVKSIFFDFLKYIKVTFKDSKGKIKTKNIERRDIFLVDNVIKTEKAYVFVELTDEIKQSVIDWFIGTIHTINNDFLYKKGDKCGYSNYFCKNLCSYFNECMKQS